jgi:hypothetical protein
MTGLIPMKEIISHWKKRERGIIHKMFTFLALFYGFWTWFTLFDMKNNVFGV